MSLTRAGSPCAAGSPTSTPTIEAVRPFKVPVLVGINRYPSDTEAEYKIVLDHCAKAGVRAHVADIFARGGDGGGELAKGLRDLLASERSDFAPLYPLDQPVKAKLDNIARRIFKITVNDIYISAGAGFLVAITGDITRKPNAEGVGVTADGRTTGLI